MPSYSRPGVFVNQSLTPLTASPSGVTGGAVACFAGAYNIGPTQPTLVTSWQNFVNLYGGFPQAGGSPLAYAVYQYFNNGGTGCIVYRVPNTDAVVASLVVASVLDLAAPAAPTVSTLGTGGTIAAGIYQVVVTYVDAAGETMGSTASPVTTTGSTSTITVTSPAASPGATGWYAYVSQASGSAASATRQQAGGSPTAIGTDLTLTAPPTSTGPVAPVSNTSGDTNLLTFIASSPGAWANSLYTEIVPGNAASATDPTSVFTLNVYQGGTAPGNLVETWPAVSLNPASTRNLVTLVNATNGGSKYLTAQVSFGAAGYVAGSGASDPAGSAGAPVALSSGSDGTVVPAMDTAITTGVAPTGNPAIPWNSPGLGNLGNQVINLNIPAGPDAPVTQSVVNNVVSWATSQGNVFVVLDVPFGGVPIQSSSALVASYSQYLTAGGSAVNGSPNAALYGPWLSIQDPASSSPTATRWVAPGGAVLGVWARSDLQSSVAQTPAGVTATVSAAALEAYFSTADLGNLENYQVNPVKLVPGAGFCVFGGRTLSTGYPNRYINIARTLMQFSNDFVNITQFAIFQNNDAALWQSIATVLTSYLMQAMQSNMLAGPTPETSFAVICDGTTTSAAQAQAGIVNATVAVALVSPAEFIIINLSQMQGGGSATVSS